ncbi:hypothetical protein B0T10DRAFT_567011 [Thelonectria olida]|uniref:SET domain-containing protein n=1 Tax=Thelonectria olida TaxID=1576542 RepID=A0A9P8VU01_9HYPO|nr:hypothetical protein B0T10DRAFT_567011 [Thelonectria olida]
MAATNMAPIPRATFTHALLTGNMPQVPASIIQDVPTRGKGHVAVRDIAMGERICEEDPILTIANPLSNFTKEDATKAMDDLDPSKQGLVFSLHNPDNLSSDAAHNILRSNSLQLNESRMGIFLSISRMNHACNNNAHAAWNSKSQKMAVHACRDIAKGEEICISYLGRHADIPSIRKIRQDVLLSERNFVCSCSLCTLPPALQAESDKRLAEVRHIYENSILNIQAPIHRLQSRRRALALLSKDNLFSVYAPDAFASMALLCIACSDLARGRTFFELATRRARIILGEDHPVVAHYQSGALHPSFHHMMGTWCKWQTCLSDIPKDLSGGEFQNWLWREGVEPTFRFPIKYADFADHKISIPFSKLPLVHAFDPDLHFYGAKGPKSVPLLRRTWLFLGEIVGVVSTFPQVILTVRDSSLKPGDPNIPVAFADPSNGRDFFPIIPPRIGTTIAVLYPVRNVFGDGVTGLSISLPNEFTIFPAGLQQLMHVSDQVKRFSNPSQGFHSCHACGAKRATLRCAGCQMFSYCDEDCREFCRNGTHEEEVCRLLQNRDILGLFLSDYEEWDGLKFFPFP